MIWLLSPPLPTPFSLPSVSVFLCVICRAYGTDGGVSNDGEKSLVLYGTLDTLWIKRFKITEGHNENSQGHFTSWEDKILLCMISAETYLYNIKLK
jgi:hypothetical protein